MLISVHHQAVSSPQGSEQAAEHSRGATQERHSACEHARERTRADETGSIGGRLSGSLGNNANNSSPLSDKVKHRQLGRSKRYGLREKLRAFSGLERLRKCGHTPVDTSGVVVRNTQTAGGNIAGFRGLATCGSVWACPVCSAKIAVQRSSDLSRVLTSAQEKGYSVALMTFTVRHNKGDSLKSVWQAVTSGWSRVTSGKAWLSDKGRFNIQGWAKAVEVTHGSNGWHVHIHVAVVFAGTEQDAQQLGAQMWTRWQAGIQSAGFTAIRDSGGLDVTLAHGKNAGGLGRYLAKQSDFLALEMTRGVFKQGRKQSKTPFEIAGRFLETGDEADLKLWREWEKTSRGRRQLTWSKGLREWAGLYEEELTDEEAAAQEFGTVHDDLVLLPPASWRSVQKSSWKLLDVAERGGKSGVLKYLENMGLTWEDPPREE